MSPGVEQAKALPLRPQVGAATKLQSGRLIALVAVFGILAFFGLTAVVLGAIRTSRSMALEEAELSAANLTLAVSGTVARTVQSVDVLLQSLASQYDEAGWDQPPVLVDEQLRSLLRFMPHVRQLAIVAQDGTVLGDSGGAPRANRLDLLQLKAEATAAPGGLVVGTSRPGRYLGAGDDPTPHRYLPMFRLHHPRRGGAAMFLVAAVNPLYFQDIFASLDLPPSARPRLWRYDGTLLVGGEDERAYAPAAHAAEPLFSHWLKQGEFGIYNEVSDDAIPRLTGYRSSLNLPLVVSVGLARDDVLARWRDGVWPLLWPVVALAVGLVVVTVLLTRTLILRARAETTLILSERVLETVSNGVAISDATLPDLPLVYVNPAFERISGYTAAAVLGRNPRFLHGDDRKQAGLDDVRAALAEGRSVDVVVRNYRADGTLYWNEMTISAVRAVSGRLTHFVAIQRDITEQERQRVQLAEAYARIERYSAELERFSFILAHHLQEPARHISLYSQLISRALDGDGDPELRQNLDYLGRAGGRLKGLLRDVQLYLAIDRLVMTGGSCQAEAVLDKEWEARARALSDADLVVTSLPRVQVPSRRLADLFAILIDNAICFRHPERPLRVVVEAQRQEDGLWRFSFADNGIGIPPEFLERVFGVFERLQGRELYPGNGVGLAIARKLVETLGGSIHAQSDGVSGTAIVFTLPAAME